MTEEQLELLKRRNLLDLQLIAPRQSIGQCCGAQYGWYKLPRGLNILIEGEPAIEGKEFCAEFPRYEIETRSIPVDGGYLNLRINRAADFGEEWEDLYEEDTTDEKIKTSHPPVTEVFSGYFQYITDFLASKQLVDYAAIIRYNYKRVDFNDQEMEEAFAVLKEQCAGKWILFIVTNHQNDKFLEFAKKMEWDIKETINEINNLVHDNEDEYNYLTSYLIKA